MLGLVAESDAHQTGIQEAAGSIMQHSVVHIGHEVVSMAILSLPVIQVGQLSVTGKRVCTKYWLTP